MYEIFERLLKERGLSVADVCRATGIRQSTMSNWKKRNNALSSKNVKLIADFFDVSIDYLMGQEDAEKFQRFAMAYNKANDVRKGFLVPVLGRVAAGIPISAVQEIIDYEELPETMNDGSDYFGLRIKGDSMSPRICDGDVVIVRKQNDAESGDIVIALINGDDGVCKKLSKNQNGIGLISLNPVYEPMYYTWSEIDSLPVEILGKVVELRAKF